MASLGSSFSGAGADVNAIVGTGGAGDLDLGDLTRFAPFLLDSVLSLFATRTLALRGADTTTHGVSERALRKNEHAFIEVASTHRQRFSPQPPRYWARPFSDASPNDLLLRQACSPCASAPCQRVLMLMQTVALGKRGGVQD